MSGTGSPFQDRYEPVRRVFPAFCDFAKHALIDACCLIHLKGRSVRQSRLIWRLVLVSFLAVLGCSDGPEEESKRGAFWRISAEPLLIIGYEDDPAHTLSGVVGAVLLDDGSIAVGDGASREIRIFSANGTHRVTMGGEGSGPGEFRSLRAIGHGPRDGVCGWDVQVVRVTCFSSDGDVQQSASLDITDAMQLRPAFVGVFADHSVVLRDEIDIASLRDQPEGVRRDSVYYLRYDSTGAFIERVASLVGSEYFLYSRDGVWLTKDVIFGREAFQHLDADRLLIARNDSVDLRIFDSAGEVRAWSTHGFPAQRVDQRMLDHMKERLLQELEKREAKPPIRMDAAATNRVARANRDAIMRLPNRETVPSFDDVYLDHARRVWLGAPILPGKDVRRWTVLSADFEVLAGLEIPGDATVLDVGVDKVLLLVRDALDIESIHLYGIETAK